MNRVNVDNLEPSDDYVLLTYQDQLFTGIAYEENEAGALIAEMQYIDGQKAGTAREWSECGALVKEQSFVFDSLHGPSREWYQDGTLKIDAAYELGICLREKEWASDGSLIRDFVFQPESPQFGTLEKLRISAIGRAINHRD